MSLSKRLLFILIMTIACSLTQAGGPRWPDHKYTYAADGESVKTILEDFSASYGLSAEFSEKLDLPIYGKFLAFDPDVFLRTLSEVSGMRWYFDGIRMYFYSKEEVQSIFVRLNNISVDTFKHLMMDLSAWQEDATWEVVEEANVVLVSGAPAFIDFVQSLVSLLDRKDLSVADKNYAIRIYRLKFASASDYQYSYRGQTQTMSGVGNLLSGWFSISNDRDSTSDVDVPSGFTSEVREGNDSSVELGSDNLAEKGRPRRPFLEVESRLNALIIGDLEENHRLYEALIAKLDVPSPQIQIVVTIAHLQRDALKDLGAFWQVANDSGEHIRVGDRNVSGAPLRAGEVGLMLGRTSGLLSTLRWLERSGRGEIISRPVLTTIENHEAVLDSNSTFYVRLTGREAVDLVPVTAGTLLRVTPRILRNQNGVSVRLSIHIEDGQQSKQTVDNIPVLNRIAINTQATMDENESLLVGGLYYQSDEESSAAVPILGKVPGLKHLFSAQKKDSLSTTRVFLISPKILSSHRS